MISCGGHRGEALKCSHDAPESSSQKSELFPQTHPSPPSFWSLSSFTGSELTSPTQKRHTFGECGIHFFIAGRLFVERMLHRPHSGGRGAPTCGRRGGRGGDSKRGLARSPDPAVPRQDGPAAGAGSGPPPAGEPQGRGRAWGRRGLEAGRAPGRLCYQGVSLRKGCRPLHSPTFSGTFKWEGSTPAAGGPWTRHRTGVFCSAQTGCYLFFRGPVHTPGGDTHVHTRTLPPSHSGPSKYLRSEQPYRCRRKKTHCYQDGHKQSLLPTYSPCGHMTTLLRVHTRTYTHTCRFLAPDDTSAVSGPRERPRRQGAEGSSSHGQQAAEALSPETTGN